MAKTKSKADDDKIVGGASSAKIEPEKDKYKTNPHSPTKNAENDDVVTVETIQRDYKERTYTAKATVVGNPQLRSNILIEIQGVGKKYGGKWWVKSVTHKIDMNGYTCDLDLQRDALGSKDGDGTGRDTGVVKSPSKKKVPKVTPIKIGTPKTAKPPKAPSGGGNNPKPRKSSGGSSGRRRHWIDAETGEHG